MGENFFVHTFLTLTKTRFTCTIYTRRFRYTEWV